MSEPIKVVRFEKNATRIVGIFVCSDCGHKFAYDDGFPDYCPACGEPFDATEDKSDD